MKLEDIKLENTFESQLKLEEFMTHSAIVKYFENLNDNLEKGNGSVTVAAVSLINKFTNKVADEFEAKTKGEDRLYIKAYKALDLQPIECAYISLKVLFDDLLKGDVPLSALAEKISLRIEEQNFIKLLHEEYPDYTNFAINDLNKRNAANYEYKRAVFNAVAKKYDFKYKKLNKNEMLSLGTRILHILEKTTGIIKIFKKRINKFYQSSDNNSYSKKQYTVVFTDDIINYFEDINEIISSNSPSLLPCVVEPRKWSNIFDGGFYNLPKQDKLIKTDNKEYLNSLAERDLSEVLGAVNATQDVKHRINKRVLNVLNDVIAQNIKIKKMPSRKKELIIDPPPEILGKNKEDMNDEELEILKEYKIYLQNWYSRENTRKGKLISVDMNFKLAQKFADLDYFYYVYNLCYRQRFYIESNALTPQGTDMSKGLLEFSEGVKLKDRIDREFFIIDGATKFGVDKVTFKERLDWVKENQEFILMVAESPLNTYEFWGNCDAPIEFLAWCLEYSDFIKDPENFVSHLPCGSDGSNNGSQHLALLTRSKGLAEVTNLINNGKVNDMYGSIAEGVVELIKEDLVSDDKGLRHVAKQCIEYGINRKVLKKVIMTIPYNVSFSQGVDYLMDYFEDPETPDNKFTSVLFVSRYIMRKIKNVMEDNGAYELMHKLMEYLKKIAFTMAKNNQPLRWVTPTNFLVYFDEREYDTERVQCYLYNTIVLKKGIVKDKKNKYAYKNGIVANLMHSLDSSHMVRIINRLNYHNIKSFSLVHDCYNIHAGNMLELRNIIREEFVDLYYKNDIIGDLVKFNNKFIDTEFKEFKSYGDLNVLEMLSMQYGFA